MGLKSYLKANLLSGQLSSQPVYNQCDVYLNANLPNPVFGRVSIKVRAL